MSDGTKLLAGTIAGFTALVACFALMADCSKTVAIHDADVAACIERNGKWSRMEPGTSGFCVGGEQVSHD